MTCVINASVGDMGTASQSASAGDSIRITDNGGEEKFFSLNDRGVLAFFDGDDWWAYLPTGLWCVGKAGRNFKVYPLTTGAGRDGTQSI